MMVVVQERRFNEKGDSIGVAGSFEVPVKEAVKLVTSGKFKAAGYAVGVVPEEWKATKAKKKPKKEAEE